MNFTDLCVGWPGRGHDARVFGTSRLYADAERVGTPFANSESVCICNVEVPVLLLGDPAYPIKKWLLKPYPESKNSAQSERDFNYKHSCARILVERAFGLLKGRWRILLSH